jgi:hypothetical protein
MRRQIALAAVVALTVLLVTDNMASQAVTRLPSGCTLTAAGSAMCPVHRFAIPIVTEIQTKVGGGMPVMTLEPKVVGKSFSILYWQAPKDIDPKMIVTRPNVDPAMPISLHNLSVAQELRQRSPCLYDAMAAKLDSTGVGK